MRLPTSASSRRCRAVAPRQEEADSRRFVEAAHLAEDSRPAEDGRPAIREVEALFTAADRAVLAEVPDDEPAIMRALGIGMTDSVGGSLQESIQYPSLNVRGMRAAWIGDDVRTIIPATATAEIDIRLVPDSDPARLIALLRRHIEDQGYVLLDRDPTDAERERHPRLATFTSTVSYLAFRTPFESEPGRWATRALTRLNGAPPIRVRSFGGSIPISPFVTTLGVPAVVVPTVNPDNNQHSPNENIRLGDFLRGIVTIAAVANDGARIVGNIIGPTADGQRALGNAFGIEVVGHVDSNGITHHVEDLIIGGIDPDAGNLISSGGYTGTIYYYYGSNPLRNRRAWIGSRRSGSTRTACSAASRTSP